MMFLEDMDVRTPDKIEYLKEIADLKFEEYILEDRGVKAFKLVGFEIKDLEPIRKLKLDLGISPRFLIVREKVDSSIIVRRLDGAYIDLGFPLISDYAKLICSVALSRQIMTLKQYFSFADKFDERNKGMLELLGVLGLLTALNLVIYYNRGDNKCIKIL